MICTLSSAHWQQASKLTALLSTASSFLISSSLSFAHSFLMKKHAIQKRSLIIMTLRPVLFAGRLHDGDDVQLGPRGDGAVKLLRRPLDGVQRHLGAVHHNVLGLHFPPP